MKDRRGYLFFLIFIFFLASFTLISNGRYGGDGLENYLTAESIVLNHNLSIYDKPFDVKGMRYDARGQSYASGKRYSAFGVGIPILLVPLYLIGHILSKVITVIPHDYITQFLVSFSNPIIISLTAVALFSLLLELGFNKKTSLLTVICFGFCSMSPAYARSGFSEPAIGLLLISAVMLLYRYELSGSMWNIAAVSCLTGYAILIKNNSFLYIPLLLGYLLYGSFKPHTFQKKLKLWLAICIPIAFFVIVYGYFHYLMGDSGSGKPSMYKEIMDKAIPERFQILKGLAYYLFSTGKGYFFYNLPLFLSLFGVAGFIRRRKDFAVFLLGIVLVNLLFYSFRFNRGSIFSWGPRYLFPTVPIMCIFFAQFIRDYGKFARTVLAYIFLILGFIVQLPSIFINFSNYLFFIKEQLGAQEYMINYIPDLSPIRGAWSLLISAICRTLNGASIEFTYNPDSLFVQPVTKSLSGYDIWDIWFVNAFKVFPGIFPAAIAAIIFLLVVIIITYLKIHFQIKNGEMINKP